MKKVITYGTFDLLHLWHINIFQRARELWDYLVVWISSDEFNKIKWKKSFFSFDERKKILESIKYVDEVIAEDNWEQKINDIKSHNIDVFVMWDDWEWKFNELKEFCEVKYLPRTKEISSTKIKTILKWLNVRVLDNLKESINLLEELKKVLF